MDRAGSDPGAWTGVVMRVEPSVARGPRAKSRSVAGPAGTHLAAERASSPAELETIAIDPVCGMAVERARSVSIERDGRLLFFCSRGCRDELLGVGSVGEAARAEELVRRVLDDPTLLRPVFQPILSLYTRRVVGYEALARFAPVPLQPAEAWFDLAARAGLAPELEALALRASLAVVVRRPPPAEAFVSLNVAPLLLDDARIASLLEATPLPPERIVLELTERDRVADYEALRNVLAPYRAAGFRIAIDDAGAGYASLRHVTELQPDFVKLDARLISGLTGDLARQAVVRAMATFVHEIGAVLVAEGVERIEDLDLLTRVGQPMLVQGHVIGRPNGPWAAASDLASRHLRAAGAGP